jgi:hypothetical protein
VNNTSLGWLAYRLGPARQIRDAILTSARANEPSCEAEDAIVKGISYAPSKAESAWLKRYHAARAKNGGAA